MKLAADIHTLRAELERYKAATGAYPPRSKSYTCCPPHPRILGVTITFTGLPEFPIMIRTTSFVPAPTEGLTQWMMTGAIKT